MRSKGFSVTKAKPAMRSLHLIMPLVPLFSLVSTQLHKVTLYDRQTPQRRDTHAANNRISSNLLLLLHLSSKLLLARHLSLLRVFVSRRGLAGPPNCLSFFFFFLPHVFSILPGVQKPIFGRKVGVNLQRVSDERATVEHGDSDESKTKE